MKDNSVIAGGAAKLHHLISVAVGEGLAGLETLVGIPGTVGGALHINAGIETADIGQHLASATVLTRNAQVLTRQGDDLRFAYQQSSLDELVILDACFKLERGSPAELYAADAKDLDLENRWSTFRNAKCGLHIQEPQWSDRRSDDRRSGPSRQSSRRCRSQRPQRQLHYYQSALQGRRCDPPHRAPPIWCRGPPRRTARNEHSDLVTPLVAIIPCAINLPSPLSLKPTGFRARLKPVSLNVRTRELRNMANKNSNSLGWIFLPFALVWEWRKRMEEAPLGPATILAILCVPSSYAFHQYTAPKIISWPEYELTADRWEVTQKPNWIRRDS